MRTIRGAVPLCSLCALALLSTACGADPEPPAVSASGELAPLPEAVPSASVTTTTPPPLPGPPPPPPMQVAPRSEYATVNGLKMHYLRLGDRSGEARPVLVLLHPGGESATVAWPLAIPFFAQAFDVIAPDQLAQGGTADDAKHPMTTHAMAEDTVALLAQLGVSRAILVGWSDGANLALDIGMHDPDMVAKIVASSGNFRPDGTDQAFNKIFLHLKADDPRLKESRDAYARESPDGAAHYPVVFDRLRKMWQTDPRWTTKQLGTIKAPTLIIAGDHDAILTTHTVALAAAIPGAELAIVPNADHEVPVKDSARWNGIVMTFLEESPKAPPPAMR